MADLYKNSLACFTFAGAGTCPSPVGFPFSALGRLESFGETANEIAISKGREAERAGSEVGTSKAAKKHLLKIFPREKLFDTPKPEELICRILHIATNPGDLVLDAYLGSGTTAAVAHKMKRRYIGIEHGKHAVTHCAERLRLVVAAEPDGISKLVDWKGGGGVDFYRFNPQI